MLSLTASTVTLGITAPEGSDTVPVSVARNSCAPNAKPKSTQAASHGAMPERSSCIRVWVRSVVREFLRKDATAIHAARGET